VSNLQVDTNATLSGTETAVVAVINNTTGATLLSCTVEKVSKSTCTNGATGGTAGAASNIEVKVTTSGLLDNNKQWRVRFRD
jgi:hypothetical protein